MPGFCVSCGAPLTGAFCNLCGARAVAPGAPVPQAAASSPVAAAASSAPQTTSQPAGPVAKGSGLGKVLAIVGGILLLLFVIGIASAVYGVYWLPAARTTPTLKPSPNCSAWRLNRRAARPRK